MLKLSFAILILLCPFAHAEDHADLFLKRYAEEAAWARKAAPAPVRQEAPQFEIVNGFATRTHGFNANGEVWVQSGQQVTRLLASSNATVVYEDGSVARYADVQKSLRDWVMAYGPMGIQVHRYAGGAAFQQIRILPVAPRR